MNAVRSFIIACGGARCVAAGFDAVLRTLLRAGPERRPAGPESKPV